MLYSSRVYRQRNAHTYDIDASKDKQEFFNGSKESTKSKESKPSFFQAKLSVGQPNDKYEQEADAVANTVVNHPKGNTPIVQQKEISSIQRYATPTEDEKFSTNDERMKHDKEIQEKPEVQAKCTDCEKEEKEKKAAVQKKSDGGSSVASPQVSSKIEKSSGKGNKLSRNTLSAMNQFFGADFSNVHIHTDSEAVLLNKKLGAQAFTQGRDIYFNSGKYNDDTADGRQLLAHELTHVIQQGFASSGKKVQRLPESFLGDLNPFTEEEALVAGAGEGSAGNDQQAVGGAFDSLRSLLGDVIPVPLALPAWTTDFLGITLFSNDATCAGTASPKGKTMMSNCNVAHFCTTPANFAFEIFFHFDVDMIPRPAPFIDADVVLELDFVPDGQTTPTFSQHKSGKGVYTGAGNPLSTPFGTKFSFSSSKDGTLSVLARMFDNTSGITITYADNIRCTIIPCA